IRRLRNGEPRISMRGVEITLFLLTAQHHNRARARWHAAPRLRESRSRLLDLSRAALPAHLGHDPDPLLPAAGLEQLADAERAAGYVDRQVAVVGGCAFGGGRGRAAGGGEPQRLHVL